MQEVELLRLLVAGLIGVDANGVPNFSYPSAGGGGGSGASDVNLAEVSGVAIALGATTPAASLPVTQSQSSSVPTNTAGTPFTALTTDGDVFTLAAGQKGFIQNLDDVVLNVKLGTGASTSSFSMKLKAGTAADDGTGGYTIINDWVGVVSVAAATGSPRFVAWKI